jgi:hypothetical protein
VPDPRPWLSAAALAREEQILERTGRASLAELARRFDAAVLRNRTIHEHECVSLNPATNVMNPDAEAVLASGLGTRPSLGHPGEKYQMGLEAIEELEVVTADLARRVFRAPYVELRVGSGSLANLYAFMATCRPGDHVVVPPAAIAGHVTHQAPGAAGWYGLDVTEAPVDADRYSVDVPALADLAERLRPRLITIGGSLNLHPHPVEAIREVADAVGAYVLFDAAHLAGLIAGGAWPNPLEQGAHLLTMSTYKSLAGPPAGIVATTDPELAGRLDAIAIRAHRELRRREGGRPRRHAARLAGRRRGARGDDGGDGTRARGGARRRRAPRVHGRRRRHHLARVRARGGRLGRRTGHGPPAPRGERPHLRHRADATGRRGRPQRAPARHARARAVGRGAGRRTRARPASWRGRSGTTPGGGRRRDALPTAVP